MLFGGLSRGIDLLHYLTMKKWFAVVCLGIVVGSGLGGGLYWVYTHTMPLQNTLITGLTYTPSSEVAAVLQPLYGRNALMVSVLGVANRRVLSQLNKIQTVSSDFHWPNGMTVTVTEKKPWLGFLGPDQTVVIAHDGTLLTNGDVLPQDPQLILVRGVTLEAVSNQKKMSPHLLETLRAITIPIRRVFPRDECQIDITGLIVGPNGVTYQEVILIKNDTLPIYLGSEDDLPQKLRQLTAYFAYRASQPTPNAIDYIDVRLANRIVVKYAP